MFVVSLTLIRYVRDFFYAGGFGYTISRSGTVVSSPHLSSCGNSHISSLGGGFPP